MKMLEAIIFDLDGTLLNTLYDLKEAVNYALRKHNFNEITLEETRSFVGNGVKKLVERALKHKVDEKTFTDVFNDFKGYYDIHQKDYTVPYDGVLQTITQISELNIKMAIVSNKYQFGVDNLCKPLFGEYIDVFVGSRENVKLKPNPDMVFLACDSLKVNPLNCLFVGDSDVDAKTGKNAKMKVVGVTWGYKDEQVLKDENVDYIIHKPQELLDIIKKEINNHE